MYPIRRFLWPVLLSFFVMAMFFVSSQEAVCAADKTDDLDKQIKQQEQEYQKIQSQISSTKKKISDTAKKEASVSQQIEELSQKISVTQQNVNVVYLKVKKVKQNVIGLTKDIATISERIKKSQKLLSERIVSIYKYGGVTEFNLLLSSQGAEDALANSYLLVKIAEQDQALICDLSLQKKRLNETQDELKLQQKNLITRGEQLKQQHEKLRGAANERNALLERVRRDKRLYMAQQNELLRASKELQSTIKRLLSQKRKLAEKKYPGKKETVYYKGGRFAWPTKGNITSSFGTRIHPVFKTKIVHTGIDISAPKGTPVTAADAGEVLYTGWLSGYGHVVILDHGANLTTVYAHLSQIECSEGQKVNRGQLIGRVGATGIATGNHLHFEVRVNGDAVNPMKYLN